MVENKTAVTSRIQTIKAEMFDLQGLADKADKAHKSAIEPLKVKYKKLEGELKVLEVKLKEGGK